MRARTTALARLGLLGLLGLRSAAAAQSCEFEDDVDYSAGSQLQPAGWPKAAGTKEACCAACAAAPGCAAGVFALDPHGLRGRANCWYKDEAQVAHKGEFQGWPKVCDLAQIFG
jgi:hypothetical protein